MLYVGHPVVLYDYVRTPSSTKTKKKKIPRKVYLQKKKSNFNFNMYFNMHQLHFVTINYNGILQAKSTTKIM
jgi:hypothetical protein